MVLSKKELGSLIKKARNLKSEKINRLYTQKMLASDLNKSQSYIGDLESGRTYPSFKLLSQIAAACEVPISFFQDSEQLNKDIEIFIKSQLGKAEGTDISKIADHIKNDPETDIDYIQDCLSDNSDTVSETQNTYQCSKSETAEEAVRSFLHHPAIKDFCELDIDKLTEDKVCKLTNDFLDQLKLISYKYKFKLKSH